MPSNIILGSKLLYQLDPYLPKAATMKLSAILSTLGLCLSLSNALPAQKANSVKREDNLLDAKISPSTDWITKREDNLLDAKISPSTDWIKKRDNDNLLDAKISPSTDWIIKKRDNLLDAKISPSTDWIKRDE